MNMIHSFVAYGNSTAYILGSPDSSSLAACMQVQMHASLIEESC